MYNKRDRQTYVEVKRKQLGDIYFKLINQASAGTKNLCIASMMIYNPVRVFPDFRALIECTCCHSRFHVKPNLSFKPFSTVPVSDGWGEPWDYALIRLCVYYFASICLLKASEEIFISSKFAGFPLPAKHDSRSLIRVQSTAN